jgi:hypothetical protein
MVGTENHLGDGDVGGAKIHSFRSSESKAKGALYLHYEGTCIYYLPKYRAMHAVTNTK